MIPNEIKTLTDGDIKIEMASSFLDDYIFDYDIIRESDKTIVGYCGINLGVDRKDDYLGDITYEIF